MKKTRALLVAMAIAGMMAASVGNISSASAASQGTEGTEIQVMEPGQLEIQLGTEWAGREFQLKTDAGLYPGTISVGQDGVLRTELGGSKSYILTCLSSGNPVADLEQTLATEDSSLTNPDATAQENEIPSESGENVSREMSAATSQAVSSAGISETATSEKGQEKEIAGIPFKHLVIFSIGMVVAVGILVAIHITQKRRDEQEECDEDDYDYEEDE